MLIFEHYKLLFSIASILLTIAAFSSYLLSIYRGKTRPHAFTWVIWSLTTWIVFFAQDYDGGGFGAWPTAVSAAIATLIAIISWKSILDEKPSWSDSVFLIISILSIIIWYLTSSPLLSVIILTAADVFAFMPTLKKTFKDPESEDLTFYLLSGLKFVLSIFALEHFSLTTLIFPIAISFSCIALVIVAFSAKIRKL